MFDIISKLLQVQERDQRLRNLQKDLKDIPMLQARAKDQLAGDQAACDAAQAKVREVEVKIKNVELDIQTRQNTIKRLHDQQFETRKNDEFQALGNEVIRYQNEVRGLEDQEIEHMEALEAAKAVLQEAQGKLAVTQGHVNDELKQLDERAANLQTRITELKADRAAIVQPLAPDSLNLYDRLMKSKGNSAIVPVDAGVCGGCHMKLVSATINALKANDAIVHCEQCGRILYFD
ncbi:MAG: hypothetical protein JNM99_17015 [Verrucomicrobiaceae bacterium]|nr:hypothetical protein [Verrucomicrobiaceae bacterium]